MKEAEGVEFFLAPGGLVVSDASRSHATGVEGTDAAAGAGAGEERVALGTHGRDERDSAAKVWDATDAAGSGAAMEESASANEIKIETETDVLVVRRRHLLRAHLRTTATALATRSQKPSQFL